MIGMTCPLNRAALRSKESIAGIRRWPTPRSKTWTAEFLGRAANDANVMAVVAIGSAVRPVARSVDLDLIVVCKEPPALRVKPPLEIDLRAFRASQVEREVADGNDLLGWAIRFGRVLFQRNGYWDAVVDSWHSRLPLPSVDLAVQRSHEAFHRLTKVLALGDSEAAEEQAISYATHLARAELLKRDVYPASRPELPDQLKQVGCDAAAEFFERLIDPTVDHSKQISLLIRTQRLGEGADQR